MEGNGKRDRAHRSDFGLRLQRLDRAPLSISGFPFGFFGVDMGVGILRIEFWSERRKNSHFQCRRWLHCGSDGGRLFFRPPSSSSPAGSGAARVRIFWEVMFKYSLHVDLGRPCKNTWPTPNYRIALIWETNMGRTIRLNLVIRSHLKKKRIWVVRACGRRSRPLDPLACGSPAWTHVCVSAMRRMATGRAAEVTVHVAKFSLFSLLPQFFIFLFKYIFFYFNLFIIF